MMNFEKKTRTVRELAEFMAKIADCEACPVKCERYVSGDECAKLLYEWLKKESEGDSND